MELNPCPDQRELCKKYIKCPYDPQHLMPEDSLSNHFNTCKTKEEIGHLFGHCIYNGDHIIMKAKMENHEKTCKDRKNFQEVAVD